MLIFIINVLFIEIDKKIENYIKWNEVNFEDNCIIQKNEPKI